MLLKLLLQVLLQLLWNVLQIRQDFDPEKLRCVFSHLSDLISEGGVRALEVLVQDLEDFPQERLEVKAFEVFVEEAGHVTVDLDVVLRHLLEHGS